MSKIRYCIGRTNQGDGLKMLEALNVPKVIYNVTLETLDEGAKANLDRHYARPFLWYVTDDNWIAGMDINTSLSKLVIEHGEKIEF